MTRYPLRLLCAGAVVGLWGLAAAGAVVSGQNLERPAVDGIRNFTRVDATVGCGGATAPGALAQLREMGFRTVVNLRAASEPDARLEESQAAAATAGLRYVHLPFDVNNPDPAVVEQFLAVVTDAASQPVYVHCAGANRAGGLWLIKRMLVDGWEEERAVAEAEAVGLTSAPLKQWALGYVSSKRK